MKKTKTRNERRNITTNHRSKKRLHGTIINNSMPTNYLDEISITLKRCKLLKLGTEIENLN